MPDAWEARQSTISRAILELQTIAHDTDAETAKRILAVADRLDDFLEGAINPVVRRQQEAEDERDRLGDEARRFR